jgi:hypothetical protein
MDAPAAALGANEVLDLEAFNAAPLAHDPFDHIIIPNFIRPEIIGAVNADYPRINHSGSFPPAGLKYGPVFASLLEALHSPAMTQAFAAKFDMDLSQRPIMITVRGRTDASDGRIHTDSKTKLITVLLYMNSKWDTAAGRLRLLRSADNLDDMVTEVPPAEGTLLAFRNGPTAWHGHHPFVGERRAIQLNWVTDDSVVRREQRRHGLSAFLKQLNPFASH